ncbi:MAG: DUF4886 domain-containing protein [Clostridia bacterium]|nr:DUF4886 domain-containing protein [Clostridia bacterium]
MNILAIGNSFSQDATAYLEPICKAAGREDRIVNLYIGGCPLKLHWENICKNAPRYEEQLEAQHTGRMLSIAEALEEGPWDVVTLQQASHDSGLEKTYYPYLSSIASFVRWKSPQAKVWIHQTWAYEIDSNHGSFPVYDRDQNKMYAALTAAYAKASRAIGAPIIPCGETVQYLRKTPTFDYANGGLSLCRDGFHLSIPYGRYVAAAVWFEMLTGGDITQNTFVPQGADPAIIELLRGEVHRFVAARKENA